VALVGHDLEAVLLVELRDAFAVMSQMITWAPRS